MLLNHWRIALALLILLLLPACRNGQPPAGSSPTPLAGTPFAEIEGTAVQATITAPTPTPIPPTPTIAIPVVAYVNGEPIYLPELDAAVAGREQGFYGALDPALSDEQARALILDRLVEEKLIAQAAAARGVSVTDEMIAAEMAELRRLADESGVEGGYAAWLQANGWTEEDLAAVVAQQLLLDQMVALITADVPETAPQAHARYLQVDDLVLAETLVTELTAGADFATLARTHSLDRATGEDGGDLGYFPAGTLFVPEIEAAAFALQPGEFSPIIIVTDPTSGRTTYYIVQLIALDPARPLTADARARLLQERFEAWVAELWANADIVLQLDQGG
jgi:parvulin-like peptidyl-prolyl isomerase